LSETMLLHDNGPVLIISATSLTLSSRQKPFGTQLVKNLIDPRILRIGDAMLQAKHSLQIENDSALQEISDTFTLFGDPTTLIKRPNAGPSD
jgi:Peptidase family C25